MNTENVARLIMASAFLAHVRQITIIEPEGPYIMRAVLHILLRANPGSNKSTTLAELSRFFGVKVYTSITRAGLIGSIENRENTEPAVWVMRNNLLLLDEYEVNGNSTSIDTMNQLLEGQQEVTRKIARKSPEVNEKDKDLYWKVREGEISIKTRFSAIIMTMKNPKLNREVSTSAFLSRCIYVYFDLNQEDLEKIADGHKLFKFDYSKIHRCGKNGKGAFKIFDNFTVSLDDYNIIRKKIKEAPDFQPEKNYLRMVGDCVRYFVANSMVHDDMMYAFIVKCHVDAYNLVKDVFAVKGR